MAIKLGEDWWRVVLPWLLSREANGIWITMIYISSNIAFRVCEIPNAVMRYVDTCRGHVARTPIASTHTARVTAQFSFSCNIRPHTHFVGNGDATAVLCGRFLGTTGMHYVLVAGPRGSVRGRKRVRVRFPDRAFPVSDASTILQWAALRPRFTLDVQDGAETDGFGQLPEQRMDDG